MALGVGRVWDVANVLIRKILISTTITNRLSVRMVARNELGNRESLAASIPSSRKRVMTWGLVAKLLDDQLVVLSLPARGIFPEEGKDNLAACGERFRWQIDVLNIPSAFYGVAVLTALPVVKTPVHAGRFHQKKAQLLSTRQGACLVIEAPVEVLRRHFFRQVSFHRLRWLVENFSVNQRPAQFDVFGVSPN